MRLPDNIRFATEWVLETEAVEERQMYWRLGRLHAARTVVEEHQQLHLYRDQDGQRGAAIAHLTGQAGDEDRVADALEAALLARNPAWSLPTGPVVWPEVPLGKAALASEAEVRAFGETLQAQIHRHGVSVSHLEVFFGLARCGIESSSGRQHGWHGARAYMDLVLSLGEGDASAEFRLGRHACRLENLMPEEVMEDAVRVLRDRQHAGLPPTGTMPVILPADELATLLGAVAMHTSGKLVYTGALSRRVGDPLVESYGDGLTVTANPLRPDALSSCPTDASTVPARSHVLVEGGVIQALHADPQFGAYLGIDPTGPLGTLEWKAGTATGQALKSEGPVVEVVAFSGLMPNPLSGDFAAEIRMGYLHDGGRSRPITQGSVTGNLFEALRDCRLSRETAAVERPEQGYFGPRWVRFERLTVAGA